MSDKNTPQLIHRLRFATAKRLQCYNPRFRIHAPFARANDSGARIKESNKTRMGDDGEGRKNRARPRRNRSACRKLQGNQQKFEREREEYYETTLANALNGSGRPSFWR
jgi:hypothetical protein